MRGTIVILTMASLMAMESRASGQGIYEGGHRTRDDTAPPGTTLALITHRIKAVVHDGVATFRLEQEFRNTTSRTIHGTWLLPLPALSSATGLHLVIDGRAVAGEILDAAQARELYREAVRRAADPGLLEYAGEGLLRASVAPIGPAASVCVAVDFVAQVEHTGRLDSLRLPVRFAAERGSRVVLDIELTATLPITTVYSPTHEITIARQGDRKVHLTFDGKPGVRSDFQLYYQRGGDGLGVAFLANRRPAEDGTFALVLTPDPSNLVTVTTPRDIVFVLDRSGSMAGAKWELAIRALRHGLTTLAAGDRFAIVSFATDVRAYKPALVGASADEVRGAGAHLDDLRPAGGTNFSAALDLALAQVRNSQRLRLVAWISDGLPTIGEVDPERILLAAQTDGPQVRMFTFGIGHDVNTILLDGLAEGSRGASDYVDEGADLTVPIKAFFAKVAEPQFVAPSMHADTAELYDLYPQSIPDLFAGESVVITGRYRGVGRHAITVSGTRGTGEVSYAVEVELPAETPDNPSLPAIWAARKIGFLLAEIRRRGAEQELAAEVTALGREYSIATPYSSALAIEDGVPGERLRAGHDHWQPGDQDDTRSAGAPLASRAAPARDAALDLRRATGEAAVNAARAMKRLAKARSLGGLPDPEPGSFASAGAPVVRIGERTFLRAGDRLIDQDYRAGLGGDLIEAETWSSTWFDLAADPDIRPLLAAGPDILFMREGRAWWVHPPS